MVRAVKRETGVRGREETRRGEAGEGSKGEASQGVTERRVLRSRYLAVRNLISGMYSSSSAKFLGLNQSFFSFPSPPPPFFLSGFLVAFFAANQLVWFADEREDISRVDSNKFNSIISEVESLHHLGTYF